MIAVMRGRGGALQRDVKDRDAPMELSLMGNALGHNRKAMVVSWSLDDYRI
jgi:hypothetical protein